MAEQEDAHEASGQGFLRAMTAQSARASAFNRRMRWSWLRWQLTDPEQVPVDTNRPEVPGPDHRPAAALIIDQVVIPALVPADAQADDRVIVLPDAVTPSAARQVPLQRG